MPMDPTSYAIESRLAFPQENPNPVIELNYDSEITYANPGTGRLLKALGFEDDQPYLLLPPTINNYITACLATSAQQIRFMHQVEGIVLGWTLHSIPRLNVIHAYGTDITEQKELESQLSHSQKMEAVGRLAGGVAHDFNNILTVMRICARNIQTAVGDREDLAEDIDELNAGITRTADLTRQLLAFGRKQLIKSEWLDLAQLVSGLNNLFRRLLEEDVSLTAEVDPATPAVLGDKAQLENVLMNLVVNARDAMPRGGRLTIRTGPADFSKPTSVDHAMLQPGHYAYIEVKDNGDGIPRESLEHIFEPFYTTKELGKGTGLGLSTVYGVVKQHEGYIFCESTINSGTKFTIYLPATEEASALPPEPVPEESESKEIEGRRTVLLVEDEKSLLKVAGRILKQLGLNVLAASNAPEAIGIALNHDEPIDLLFTDIVMPGSDIHALRKKIEELYPDIRILYTSGYTDDVMIRHGIESSDVEFLQKPYSIEELNSKIKELF